MVQLPLFLVDLLLRKPKGLSWKPSHFLVIYILRQPWYFPYMICFIFRVYSQSHMMIPVTWHTWQKWTPSILLCMPRCLFLMECSFLCLLHRAWSAAHLVAIAGNWVTWWCLSLLVKTIPQTYILALSAASRIYVWWIIWRIV